MQRAAKVRKEGSPLHCKRSKFARLACILNGHKKHKKARRGFLVTFRAFCGNLYAQLWLRLRRVKILRYHSFPTAVLNQISFGPYASEVVNKTCSAPTGRAVSTQGNALGTNVTTIRSPVGARQSQCLNRLVSPLQGCGSRSFGYPGRCPGLTYCCPLGAKNDLFTSSRLFDCGRQAALDISRNAFVRSR